MKNFMASTNRGALVVFGILSIFISGCQSNPITGVLNAVRQANHDVKRQKIKQDFKAGMDAYEKGDYPGAIRFLQPQDPVSTADLQGDNAKATIQYVIGSMYDFGRGVPLDNSAAVEWYKLAAISGHSDAQLQLGRTFSSGQEGVPKSEDASLKWFGLAAAQGNSQAKQELIFSQNDAVKGLQDRKTETINVNAGGTSSLPKSVAPLPVSLSTYEITNVQAYLAQLDYPGPVDGQIGQRTKDAISAFNADHGNGSSHKIDKDLIEALNHAIQKKNATTKVAKLPKLRYPHRRTDKAPYLCQWRQIRR